LLYLHKLTLQVKTQLSILFIFFAFISMAQEQADYTVVVKNDKIYLEAKILKTEVETIVMSDDYCDAGTSMSFCLRNYLAEKLEIRVNSGEIVPFVIEASLANATKLQVNMSSEESFDSFTQLDITNNCFVDDMPTYKNMMKVTWNGVTTVVELDKTNRQATFN